MGLRDAGARDASWRNRLQILPRDRRGRGLRLKPSRTFAYVRVSGLLVDGTSPAARVRLSFSFSISSPEFLVRTGLMLVSVERWRPWLLFCQTLKSMPDFPCPGGFKWYHDAKVEFLHAGYVRCTSSTCLCVSKLKATSTCVSHVS